MNFSVKANESEKKKLRKFSIWQKNYAEKKNKKTRNKRKKKNPEK